MSDTPRTDEEILDPEIVHQDSHSEGWVSIDFARQLERELTDAHRTIESLRASVRELVGLLEGADAQNAIQRAKDLLP